MRETIKVAVGVTLLLASLSLWAAPPPPNEAKCKNNWVLTPTQDLAFGAFAIESGSGTVRINSSGAITTDGAITTASTVPVSTFQVTVDNTLDRTVCGTYAFDLSWSVVPAPLTGPGTAMPLNNVLVSHPTLIPTPTELPITGLTTANLPITLTFQGELATTFPQAAGDYASPAFTVDLIQSGKATSASGIATATALSPLGLSETAAMDFGTVAGGSTASTVVLNTSGARSVSGDGEIISSGPGFPGQFQLTGEPGQSYSLSINGPAVLTSASGQQISASNFSHNSSGVVPLSGSETFQVGGSLNLGPSQPAGSYSTMNAGGAPYSITVNYN
ncbi:MAG: DUF4402 domain-containing protein [Pseudomonadota bacterium]